MLVRPPTAVPPELVEFASSCGPGAPRTSTVSVNLATARAHAQVWAILSAAGTLIGPHDLWLAATCIAHGLTMVTANTRDFVRVPGLDVELWDDPH